MPLLYVCVRPQRDAAAGEYTSFQLATGLGADELAMHDLVREPLPPDALERFSGFLVGGSPFNVGDPEHTKTGEQRRLEADLERIAAAAARTETAAMFTCYGIGVVTRMLGGTVSRAYPEGTGPVDVRLTAAGRDDRLFAGIEPTFSALTAHKEGAETAPPSAVLLAENDGCPVQAFRVGDRLYATQFHPEPTGPAFRERMVVYRNDGYFDAGDFDAVAARVLGARLTEPPRILAAFAAAFA